MWPLFSKEKQKNELIFPQFNEIKFISDVEKLDLVFCELGFRSATQNMLQVHLCNKDSTLYIISFFERE